MKISPRLQYDIETALAEAYERGIEEGKRRERQRIEGASLSTESERQDTQA
jgi:hypothetical protein